MNKVLLLALLFSFILFSCDETPEQPADQTQVNQGNSVGEVRIPEEYFEALKRDVDVYLMANSDGDYEKFIEFVHPGSFEHDSLKTVLIRELNMYREAGIQQTVLGYDIRFVSEFVDDGVHDISLLVLNVRHEIILGGMYAENPKGLEGMIRDKYGRGNYKLNEAKPSYEIEGEIKMYCFAPKGEKRFYFLQDTFIQSPALAHLMEYPIMKRMKELEAEYATNR